MATMDDYFDSYDYYNFGHEFEKVESSMKGGGHSKSKHKEKKETFKYAPSGNVRKVVTKLQNAEKKEKIARQRLNSV